MTAFTEAQYVDEMIDTRRRIHRNPEEGWTEFETSWLVAERLRALGLPVLLGTDVISPKAAPSRTACRSPSSTRRRASRASSPSSRRDAPAR